MITRIGDLHDRTVLAKPPSTPRQVIDPRVAFIMRDVMRDVVDRGSGTAARRGVPAAVPISGKTGTSNDNMDLWFVGMTPDLVGAVWLGFDKQATITSLAVGGGFAAPIWGHDDGVVLRSHHPGDWPTAPPGLVSADIDRGDGRTRDAVERRKIAACSNTSWREREPAEIRSPWNVPRWGPVLSNCITSTGGVGCW